MSQSNYVDLSPNTPAAKVLIHGAAPNGTGFTVVPLEVVLNADGTGSLGLTVTGGSGAGNTVAPTNAGTTSLTANPVQGVTGGVPIPVSGTLGVTNSALSNLQFDTSNYLKVNVVSGGGGSSNTVTATAAGTTATTANPVQGVTGGIAMPISAVSLPLPTGAAQDSTVTAVTTSLGTDGTSPPTLPGGSSGVRGWLRNISTILAATQTVSGTVTANVAGGNTTAVKTDGSAVTQPVSATALPLPTGAAQDGTDSTGVTQLTGGVGIRGWLSGCFSKLSTIATSLAGTIAVSNSALTNMQFDGSNYLKVNVVTGGSGSSNTVAATAAGTTATTANPVQGVTGGVALPVSGTFWPTTQPVSATALPLPTGAATDTTVAGVTTALGTDGTSPPTLPGSSSGVRGWLRYIASLLSATQTVQFPSAQAISGTVTANVQGGNTTAVKVDGSTVTQPISASALPLPSGAAQDGTDSTGVTQLSGGVGIRGWLSGCFSKLSAIATSVSSTLVVSNPALSNLQFDSSDFLKVNIASGTITGTSNTVAATNAGTTATTANPVQGVTGGVALPVSGTFWQTTQPISASALPLPSGASQDGTDATGVTQLSGGVGIRGWLSGCFSKLSAIATSVAGTLAVSNSALSNLQFDGSNYLKVNVVTGGGGSSNTVAATAAGTTASTANPVQGVTGGVAMPVSGTFWQSTQPVSAASLPLPSGAATSAKQPALGTAGSAATDVISVQGIASMTALKTDGSGVTQPVSGTFWQTTQPVSAATLPLPSGASTSAKQPALGTAGTASSDVLTVQGITSMTPLKVDGSGVTQPVSGTFWQATQPVSGTFWQTTQPVSIATLPALAAGTNAIGQVGGKTAKVAVSPTVTASAYTTGNIVGGKITFSNALLTAGSGILESISVKSKTTQTASFALAIFDSNPSNSTWTDKTAPAINAADLPFLVGIYSLSVSPISLGTGSVYNLNGIGQALNAGATTLYGILIVTGTPTFGSTSDITVTLGLLQD